MGQVIDDPFSVLSKGEQKLRSGNKFGVLLSVVLRLQEKYFPRRPEFTYGEYDRLLRDSSTCWPVRQRAHRLYLDATREIAQSKGFVEGELRVLYFATNSLPYTNSGYSLRTHQLVSALAGNGVDIRVVTRVGYPNCVGIPVSGRVQDVEGIKYHRLLPLWVPIGRRKRFEKSVALLVSLAEEQGATLLHCTSGFQNAQLVSQAADRLGIPWVYEIRGEPHLTWLSRFSAAEKPRAQLSFLFRQSVSMELRAAKKAAMVFSISHVIADSLRGAGVARNKILVVPNGIESSWLEDETTKEQAFEATELSSQRFVGSISALVEYEGLATLIQSIPLLPRDVSVLLVGDGTARKSLEEQAAQLGVRDRVVFAGKRPNREMVNWYKCLDAFVIPRTNDEVCRRVTPIKGLMAQALGIPVVASDLPALREVTHGQATYVTPDDPRALSNAINRVLDSPETVSPAGVRDFTWKSISLEMGEAYRQLKKRD